MYVGKGITRVNARLTTLKVLEILEDQTSRERPISITGIKRSLNDRYGLNPSRDTVKAILTDLVNEFPGPGRVVCREADRMDFRTGEDTQYTFGYYYQAADADEAQDIREQIERIIQRDKRSASETVLSFRFCGYGSDGRLHETGWRPSGVLPLRIMEAYGHPYLICLLDGSSTPFHLRLDLITGLRTQRRKKEKDAKRQFVENKVNIPQEEYLATHLYMFYERDGDAPRWIRLRVEKLRGKPTASLTFLHDAFGEVGENWKPVAGTETDSGLDVEVRCLPSAIAQFARQYLDRVRIVGPEDVKRQAEEELRKDFEQYFERTQTCV